MTGKEKLVRREIRVNYWDLSAVLGLKGKFCKNASLVFDDCESFFYDRIKKHAGRRMDDANVFDPAKSILIQTGELSTMKLQNLEHMTWRELLLNAKKSNYSLPVVELNPRAQKRIVERQLDIGTIYSLRLSGQKRLYA